MSNKNYEGFLKAALYEGFTLHQANQLYKQAGIGQSLRGMAGKMAGKARPTGAAAMPHTGAPPVGAAMPPSAAAPHIAPPVNPGPMPAPLPGAAGLNGAKGIDPKLLAAIAGLGGGGAGALGMHAAHSGIEDELAQAATSMASKPLPPPHPQAQHQQAQHQQGNIPPWAVALGGLELGAGGAMAMALSEDKKKDRQGSLPPLPEM